jgi:uncharacterized protein YjiK
MLLTRILFVLFFALSSNLLHAKTIAKIPEASGICYIKESKELIVVNNDGWIYRLTKSGKILEKKHLGKYDFEGVAYDKKSNKLLLAVENKNSILIVEQKNFKILKEVPINKFYKKQKIFKNSHKDGIEDIAVHDGDIYLSKQSYNKKDSIIFKIDTLENNEAKIVKIYKHGYVDIAGLCFYNDFLYMTSDEKNLLIKYDLKKNKTIQKIKLPESAQEGIYFDGENNVYIADDNGRILRYKTKKLGL